MSGVDTCQTDSDLLPFRVSGDKTGIHFCLTRSSLQRHRPVRHGHGPRHRTPDRLVKVHDGTRQQSGIVRHQKIHRPRRLKIDIWSCNAHAPRPRGSNENTNTPRRYD